MKARVVSYQRAQRGTEAVWVLPIEQSMFGQCRGGVRCIVWFGATNLKAKPFVHDKTVIFPLRLELSQSRITDPSTDKRGEG